MRDKGLLTVLLFLILFTGVASGQEEDEENPHEEMLEDRFVCLDCHTRLPKEGETSADYFLVDLPSENCLGCHSEAEHSGVKEHEGKGAGPFPGDEQGKVSCFTCHDPHPQGSIEGRTVYDAVVDPRSRAFSRIVHFPGVKKRMNKETAFGDEKGVRLRAPLEEDRLCRECHMPIQEAQWRKGILWDRFLKFFSYSLP